ncbi:MAG: molybdenum cofactor biosynthesis protein MoaD [Myxococcales bacterium]|nr:molybdenum cofactor biosynthesis protein MoaD [Myxococcales bacterium]
MPHVTLTRHLQRFFPTLVAGDVPGATVREVIDELERRHPGLASYIVNETGGLRRHVNVFVGDEPLRDREHLSDALADHDKIFILQALSGG